jgi:nucleoside-diphosphate kinase
MPERTLGIIKPDAIAALRSGDIIALVELNKFTLVRLEKVGLIRSQAEFFYAVHKSKPFFNELVDYMLSGPVILMVLEKTNAVQEWRTLMGATNPIQATVGTIRYMFGTTIGANAVHGSDSLETAAREISFFFPELV